MLSREGGGGTGHLLVTRSSVVSVAMGNNKLLEQGIITGTCASWSGFREGETSSVHGPVPQRFPRLSALSELQWSLQPELTLLAGLQGPWSTCEQVLAFVVLTSVFTVTIFSVRQKYMKKRRLKEGSRILNFSPWLVQQVTQGSREPFKLCLSLYKLGGLPLL